ncbi:conserved hypothetical protein [Vibrio owensii]|jgi:hypothetical protein|uniref:STY4526/YPO1902 family pathogenicity island replication protein n=1 Tax=Vibrio TaxID=662 RepID=UPI000A2FC0AE|nr:MULTISPECIES: STY4526/YPO1902 family pathogenicity island replication protein [Vibrio]ARR47894.1 hypothetical protein CAY59_27090 [Vibrio campbellii]MDK9774677.1 DUF2857 family protein [Vibrio sp. B181a]CAH1525848.1 conserved hypothetical protein [Vibrio owensii]CAH1565578.1 conserved hypothetical protein [Vibrio owensii]
MTQQTTTLTSEVHWAVLNHLAHMACNGQDATLMAAGFNAKMIRQLKQHSLTEIKQLSHSICGRQCAVDVDVLRKALEMVDIPEDIVVFLQLGSSNKALTHFFAIKGTVPAQWRKAVKAGPSFRQRCVPPSQVKALWTCLESLPVGHVREINREQIIMVAKTCQLSIGAIWAEICGDSERC